MLDYTSLTTERAQAVFDEYVASRPAAADRFRARWATTGQAPLTGTVDELVAVESWYFAVARANAPDQRDDLPVWWGDRPFVETVDRSHPSLEDHERPVTPQFVRVADEVSAYIGQVLAAQVPRAQWVLFTKLNSRIDGRKNRPMLVLGDPGRPVDPLEVVRSRGIWSVVRPSKPQPRSNDLYTMATIWVTDAHTWWDQHPIAQEGHAHV